MPSILLHLLPATLYTALGVRFWHSRWHAPALSSRPGLRPWERALLLLALLCFSLPEVALLDLDKLAPQAPRPTEPWAAEAKHTAERWLAGDATAGGVVRDLIRERLAAIGAVTRDDDVTKSGVVKFGSDRSEAALSAVPEVHFKPGANGLHDWQGHTFLRKEDIADSLPVAFLAVSDLAAFRAQPVHVQQAVMQVIRVVVHEELHGASAAQSSAYQGPGVGMEEAATEILARKLVREMCGYTDRTGADVPLSLPYRHASGNYVAQPHGGADEAAQRAAEHLRARQARALALRAAVRADVGPRVAQPVGDDGLPRVPHAEHVGVHHALALLLVAQVPRLAAIDGGDGLGLAS